MPSYNLKAQGAPVFHYDFPYSRFLSMLIGSLSAVVVFFIGVKYFSVFVGALAAFILAVVPHFLGFSQFIVLETWIVLFFTLCVFSYLLYLEKKSVFFLISTGILTGMNLEIKESNILIFPFYLATFCVWKKMTKEKTISFFHLLKIFIIAFITCVVIWPMPFLHFSSYINSVYNLWFKNGGLVPALIFGEEMGAHSFYYFLAVLITTPALLLLLTAFGIYNATIKRNNWIFFALLIWFATPFLMTFFHHRQHMIRYIVQFYAPLALLSAIGFDYCMNRFVKEKIVKYSLVIIFCIYLFYSLFQVAPYYLEYYNELVGGTKNVYDKKLFYIGWFGEGLKRPGEYIVENAQKNSKIGLALDPHSTSIYRSKDLQYEIFNPSKKYEYVVVNYYEVARMRFDETLLKKDYNLVYTEKADGADLVHVYKHK